MCGTGSPDLNSFQYCISSSKTHPCRIPLYVPAGEVTSEKPPSSAMHSLILDFNDQLVIDIDSIDQ